MKPLRVLHLVGALDRGGVETWLLNLLRHSDRREVAQDLLTTSARPGLYEPELTALGARILRATQPARPWAFARAFNRALAGEEPYDVVVSHLHSFGGFALALARRRGVPVRVALSHLDSRAAERGAGPARRAYLNAMRRLLLSNTTCRLAVSPEAGQALFGAGTPPRFEVLRLGFDLRPFQDPTPHPELRQRLGLPPNALVVGHVGRFDPQKNHAFLLKVFDAFHDRRPEAHLLLVGDGPLRPEVEARAAQLGLSGAVHFLGSRPDVPQLLRWAMDVFVFPSLFEGLPLAPSEAQLAGLPCVMSDRLTAGSRLDGGRVLFCPLEAGPAAWADAIQDAVAGGRHFASPDRVDIRANVTDLNALYRRGIP